jgi:hypothetical protein
MAASPSLQARCATGPAADAANLANRFEAMGEPPPWPLLEALLADCSTDRQEASR